MRRIKLALAAGAMALAGATSAYAGNDVGWSISIGSPGPHYHHHAPRVYYAPPPVVYYHPAPVYFGYHSHAPRHHHYRHHSYGGHRHGHGHRSHGGHRGHR